MHQGVPEAIICLAVYLQKPLWVQILPSLNDRNANLLWGWEINSDSMLGGPEQRVQTGNRDLSESTM